MYEPLVRTALLEDLGRAGDITADAIVPADKRPRSCCARASPAWWPGSTSRGWHFSSIDPAIRLTVERPDGSVVAPGDVIATIDGPARGLLTGERTALNFLCHLSGVATATASLVAAAQGTKARIVCTRKTTPGLRALEKYAVRAGGGSNHRFGLDDADPDQGQPHRAGRRRPDRDRARQGRMPAISSRSRSRSIRWCSSSRCSRIGVDAVLLDNMTVDELRQAVAMTAGRAITEASGRITAETAKAIAATGVDLISARLADPQLRRARYRPRLSRTQSAGRVVRLTQPGAWAALASRIRRLLRWNTE